MMLLYAAQPTRKNPKALEPYKPAIDLIPRKKQSELTAEDILQMHKDELNRVLQN